MVSYEKGNTCGKKLSHGTFFTDSRCSHLHSARSILCPIPEDKALVFCLFVFKAKTLNVFKVTLAFP